MMKRFTTLLLLVLVIALTGIIPTMAQDAVEVRFLCYADGPECETYTALLEDFMAENPDITVVIEQVGYSPGIDELLPAQVEAGEGPDIARITNFAGYAGQYLDLRPYLEDPDYWESVFSAAFLDSMRADADDDGIYGFQDGLSVTNPYINRTLFEQAGIEVPSDSGDPVSWEEWTEVTKQVAEATGAPYAIAIDRTGHRIAGPIISMGGTILTEDGEFTIDTQGFRNFAQLLRSWHEEEITPRDVWLASGDSYAPAIDYFLSGELVMYMAGSWWVGRMTQDITVDGLGFDWSVVPNPTGPGGSTGVAGGAGIVAFGDTDHPEAVARVMEYLIQPEVYSQYSARTLFLPAHSEVAEMDVEYETEQEATRAALDVLVAEVPKLTDQALRLNLHPFAFVYYRNAANYLSQWMLDELTLDEALELLQKEIDDAMADSE